MTPGNRRVVRRPYFHEIFILLNLLGIIALTAHLNPVVVTTLTDSFETLAPSFSGYVIAGVVVRLIVAAFRRELSGYVRFLRSAGWLVDTLRLVIAAVLLAHTYFWIKLLVPILHPRNFDQLLWNLDQTLFFGLAPSVLFAELFSHPVAMRAVDWSYARIFFASMLIASAYFYSAPARRVRMGFMSGSAVLWLGAAWLYLLVPSLGPAFRFPDVWIPYAEQLPLTHQMQATLMRNYQLVLRWAHGPTEGIKLVFGIAAFPSLHVGFQTFAFLWMRRLWIYGEIVFGLFLLIIVIGCVVTGWHYLVDAYAGALLALIAYLTAVKLWNLREWMRLRGALRT